MHESASRTLLLNQSYLPVAVISWKKAVVMLFTGKVETVKSYNAARSPSTSVKVPSVVRLMVAFRRPKKAVKFSRLNVYTRDNWTCQYCAVTFDTKQLTYDHVVPRALGGVTSWVNIVTCCRDCNTEKGGRTPKQVGWELLKRPVHPKWLPTAGVGVHPNKWHHSWKEFLRRRKT